MHIPLIAWGPFASSWMLLWGMSAAIPVLLHFWSRRQRKRLRWAAMQFLVAAIEKRAQRFYLERMLLLLLRAAILIVLATALADPVGDFASNWLPSVGGTRTHTMLVVDGSFSMTSRSGERSCIVEARDRAIRLVREANQGDAFTAVLLADPPQVLVQDAVFHQQDLIAELEVVQAGHTAGDLAATFAEVSRVLTQVADRYPEIPSHRVCLLTDLARGTWGGIDSLAIRQQLRDISSVADIKVISVGPNDTSNLAITRLATEAAWIPLGEPTSLKTVVRNYAARPRRTQFELLVDGRTVATESVQLPVGQDAVLSFQHAFQLAGDHVVEARIGDDDLAVDNHRWLSLPVLPKLRVLCIEGRRGAAEFAALALAPNRDSGQVSVDLVAEVDLLQTDLYDYDCAVLCNVSGLRREEHEFLARYAHDGGGIVVLLGDRVQTSSYNSGTPAATPKNWWLPAELGQLADTAPALFFDALDYEHPIVAPFRGYERAGLLTVPIWRHVQLGRLPEQSTIGLRLTDGSPVLVSSIVGRGRSVLLATSASPSLDSPTRPWSGLPLWPCFPPLMREMVDFAISGRLEQRNVQVGSSLRGGVPAGATEVGLAVEDPLGEVHPLVVNFRSLPPRWIFGPTLLSGVYDLKADQTGFRRRRFAANVDSRESDTRRLDASELVEPLSLFDEAHVDTTAGTAQTPSRLFRLLLGLVLILVVSESFVTRWLSKGDA